MSETILLTGGTGHIGQALLPRLLAEPDTRVIALVRASDETHLSARLERLRAPLGEAGARLEAVRGDVVLDGLGLSAADRERLLGECDAVIHSAAAVRFDLPEANAADQNIRGAEGALGLARALAERGRLRRHDHVSTCYIAGDRRGRVLESEIDVGQGFRNSYEWSKCQAELRMAAARAEGLPLAVHRPSIVVGDSATGATEAFNVLYWPLKLYARGWWRTCPGSAEALVDIVPVDFVAEALVRLRQDPATVGGTYHLAVGDGALTIGALVQHIERVVKGPPIRFVEQGFYRTWVRPLLWPFFLTPRGRTIKRGGEAFLPYFVANPLFDTTAARAALGTLQPPAVADYLERTLRFAVEKDFGRA